MSEKPTNVTSSHFRDNFGEMLDRAVRGEVIQITRRYRKVAVFVDYQHHEKLLAAAVSNAQTSGVRG